jgi:hypothetical protein
MTFWVLAFESRMTFRVFADKPPARIWQMTNMGKTALRSRFILGGERVNRSRFAVHRSQLARCCQSARSPSLWWGEAPEPPEESPSERDVEPVILVHWAKAPAEPRRGCDHDLARRTTTQRLWTAEPICMGRTFERQGRWHTLKCGSAAFRCNTLQISRRIITLRILRGSSRSLAPPSSDHSFWKIRTQRPTKSQFPRLTLGIDWHLKHCAIGQITSRSCR